MERDKAGRDTARGFSGRGDRESPGGKRFRPGRPERKVVEIRVMHRTRHDGNRGAKARRTRRAGAPTMSESAARPRTRRFALILTSALAAATLLIPAAAVAVTEPVTLPYSGSVTLGRQLAIGPATVTSNISNTHSGGLCLGINKDNEAVLANCVNNNTPNNQTWHVGAQNGGNSLYEIGRASC